MRTAWTRLGILALSWLLNFGGPAVVNAEKYPQYRVDGTPLKAQEEWVIDRAQAGEAADLIERLIQQQFGKLTDSKKRDEARASLFDHYGIHLGRNEGMPEVQAALEKLDKKSLADFQATFGQNLEIRAKFLEKLLTNDFPGLKLHHHGVNLRNALISGKVDLAYAMVPFEVNLQSCVFLGDVNCEDTVFEWNLHLNNSHFKKEAYFLKMKVKISVYANKCTFDDLVNFGGVEIAQSFNAEETQFENEGKILFNSFKVGSSAYFNKAKFRGPAIFTHAKVGQLQMGWVDFCQAAEFQGLKVDYDALFKDARFYKGAQFGGAVIGRDFNAPGVRFFSEEDYASFWGLKVGRVADFSDKAIFSGPVDFDNADIGMELKLDEAEFLEEGKGIEAISLKVGSITSIKEASFNGPVNFSGSQTGGQFNAEKAKFNQDLAEVDFSGLKAGQLATFTGAVFKGDVDFSGTEIGGELRRDIEKGTKLEAIEINQRKISLNGAHLSDLSIKGPEEGHLSILALNLERAVVDRSLILKNAEINSLEAWNLQCKGQTLLKEVKIIGKANLRDSNFLNLKLFEVSWPGGQENTLLAGMVYQAISAEENPTTDRDWEPVKKWIENSQFDKRNYLQFEAYLQHSGFNGLADKIYVEMKRREWKKAWSGEIWNWPSNILKLLLLDWGVGYGRFPLRTFAFSLVLLIMGIAIFSQPGVMLRKDQIEEKLPRSKAFLYSFNLLIPFINLGPEESYRIKPEARVNLANLLLMPHRLVIHFPQGLQNWLDHPIFSVQSYAYFHQIMGHFLVPIGLAAVTGIIK